MTEFRFSWNLEDSTSNSPLENHGPLFTQWLPNGEEDAVDLKLETLEGTIHMWFERCGFTGTDGFICALTANVMKLTIQ